MKNKQFQKLIAEVQTKIIGQDDLIENIIISMIAGGHILIEGMPGLAKTRTANIIANAIEGEFCRIQFTPDLLPSDLVGTDIYLQHKSEFEFRSGPIFHNIILADEINRAPSKVQSALLEAMAEKQVTVGKKTYKLPDLFMVIATQNPLEQEGTYPLPEAQLDRFLMNILVDYPSHKQEIAMLDLIDKNDYKKAIEKHQITTQKEIFKAFDDSLKIHIDDKLKDYIVSLVNATRYPEKYDKDLKNYIKCGVSPRASIALLNCSRILALINGDKYVLPDHIRKVLPNIFRHRIIASYDLEIDNISKDDLIERVVRLVAVP